MRNLLAAVLTLAMFSAPLRADGEKAGEFDYYLLSLSWSPTWCALEGRARKSPQCAENADFGWVLHGLWPQFERGYPSYCQSNLRQPTRSMTAAMADIMGAPGVAWHQWKKHGRCTGLGAMDYFRLSRVAYDRIERPKVFRDLTRNVTLPAKVVEQAFLEANPDFDADMITVTCKANRIQEVRICLTRALEPRRCGRDVIRDCSATKALFDAIR